MVWGITGAWENQGSGMERSMELAGLLFGLRTCDAERWGAVARSKDAGRGCMRGWICERGCDGGLCMRGSCIDGQRLRTGA